MTSISQRFSLNNQVAIITGAGRGIGRAIALAYAEAGADIVCAARTQADIDEVANAVRGLGRRALAVACDINDPAQRQGDNSLQAYHQARPEADPANQDGQPDNQAVRSKPKPSESAGRKPDKKSARADEAFGKILAFADGLKTVTTRRVA